MKKTYNITVNVTIDVKKSEDGKRIPWISFKGWKHGVVNKQNKFINTEPIVKMTDENMKYIGENIFGAAREMFLEDEDLQFEKE